MTDEATSVTESGKRTQNTKTPKPKREILSTRVENLESKLNEERECSEKLRKMLEKWINERELQEIQIAGVNHLILQNQQNTTMN